MTNVASLIEQMGIDDEDIARRLSIVGMTASDSARLAMLARAVLDNLDELTNVFFDYLAQLKEAADLMRHREVVETARAMKRDHLSAMFKGTFGRGYVEERLKLGLLYAERGVTPRVFLGAFNHLIHAMGMKIM